MYSWSYLPKIPNIEVVRYCTEAYLKEVKANMSQLNKTYDKYKEKREITIRGIDYASMGGGSGGLQGSSVEQHLINQMKAEQDITDQLFFSYYIVKGFKNICEDIEDSQWLWKHYIEGVSWRVIAKRLHISKSSAYNLRDKLLRYIYLHARAVQEVYNTQRFTRILKKFEKNMALTLTLDTFYAIMLLLVNRR